MPVRGPRSPEKAERLAQVNLTEHVIFTGAFWRHLCPFHDELRRHIKKTETLVSVVMGQRFAFELGGMVLGNVIEEEISRQFIVSLKIRTLPDLQAEPVWLRVILRQETLPGIKPFWVSDIFYLDHDFQLSDFSIVDGSYFDQFPDE